MEYNGAQNAENGSDISRLVDILKDWEFKFKEKEEESKRGTIPPEPKYQDIIKTIGNVGLAVPMGFVMVHNDLNKIKMVMVLLLLEHLHLQLLGKTLLL